MTASATTQYMTYSELSALIGVKQGTIYGWVSRKMIPFVRIAPRVVRFRRDELEAWLEQRAVHPASPAINP